VQISQTSEAGPVSGFIATDSQSLLVRPIPASANENARATAIPVTPTERDDMKSDNRASTGSDSSPVNIGMILGVVLGIMLIIGLLTFFVVKRQRYLKRQARPSSYRSSFYKSDSEDKDPSRASRFLSGASFSFSQILRTLDSEADKADAENSGKLHPPPLRINTDKKNRPERKTESLSIYRNSMARESNQSNRQSSTSSFTFSSMDVTPFALQTVQPAAPIAGKNQRFSMPAVAYTEKRRKSDAKRYRQTMVPARKPGALRDSSNIQMIAERKSSTRVARKSSLTDRTYSQIVGNPREIYESNSKQLFFDRRSSLMVGSSSIYTPEDRNDDLGYTAPAGNGERKSSFSIASHLKSPAEICISISEKRKKAEWAALIGSSG
jgi:hypothetical protein